MEEQKLLKRKIKASSNPSTLISVCTDLAAHYTANNQFSKAIKEYELLSKMYKEQKHHISYAQTHRGIGEAFMGLQEFKKALEHFKIYYDVALQEHNTLEQQRALAQLGHLHLTWYLETCLDECNKKLLDEAYGYFMKSMKKCESLSDGVEKQDMIARLFSNLGLVKESLGDYDTSYKLYEKSIKICLKHDFFEQLYRGYLSLASLFEKQDNYQDAIKHYNLAVEVAKKLSSKRVELICAALLAKSETLIRIADFQGAKQVLRKAYKFKTPNKSEGKIIEKNLRVVAAMCKIEDDIITCNNQAELKLLYEKMGDGACALRNFPKAIEYYKKMLEAAERSGASDKELGECYFSLGETYKDNRDFEEAERYFEKEYNLCKNNLKDCLNTLCKIADVKETAHHSVEQIKAVYERGLEHCKKKQNLKEERGLMLRYRDFLKRSFRHGDAFKLDQHLKKLQDKLGEEEHSSSSEYESEDSNKIPIGDEIVLSDVTDLSEQSDDEVPESVSQSSKRRKPTSVKLKKNLNGEWPLHVACIKGNLKMVKYWLDVDHPVNVRDNAGWLPLHEAAVHGHLEIVRLLLDHKAAINDRGGSECNGITPLHDAASNGHLEVIELLLDRGASAVAKTDDGNTALFELKRWHDRVNSDLTSDQTYLYNKLIRRLEEALSKAGQKDAEQPRDHSTPGKENVSTSSNLNVGRLRKNIHLEESADEEDSEPESPRPSPVKEASSEYQKVMQTLRHKSFQSPGERPSTSKRSALIDEDDFVESDDWLEEDVRPAKSKKRKTGSGEFNTRQVESAFVEEAPFQDDFWELDVDFVASNRGQRRASTTSSESNRSTKKKQTSLLESGFSRERTNSTSPIPRGRLSLKQKPTQTKITTFRSQVEADSTSTVSRSPMNRNDSIVASQQDPMLFVDVEIERKVFRVPVLLSQVQTKTFRWLAEEAAHRYESKEFMAPSLELETSNGAILDDNDPLNLLFPMGTAQAEKVVGRVIEWKLPSVIDRYREICGNMGTDPDQDVCSLIETLTISLNLSDRGYLCKQLNPLLKSIINQKSLTEINLSGNFLNLQSVNLLCSSLSTLSNLEVLNLSLTGFQRLYLTQLANCISSSGSTLSRLHHLNLSHNISLKNPSLNDLNVIVSHLTLRTLKLSNVGLGEPLNCTGLSLKTLEEFNISHNRLEDEGLKKMMSYLDGTVVKTLDVSRNKVTRGLKIILDAFESSPIVLEKVGLDHCGVADSDLFHLLRLAPNLASVSATNNPDLTSITLRRLLEHGSLNYVNVAYCKDIWRYFDTASIGWFVGLNCHPGRAVCKVSGDNGAFLEAVAVMFREKYREHLTVKVEARGLTVILDSSYLSTLSNLEVLNLSLTGFQRLYLTQLANCISSSGSTLSRLHHLNLSHNISLKNPSLNDLNVIVSHLTLRTLKLSNVGLGEPLNCTGLSLKTLEEFNISHNRLEDEGLKKMMSYLDGTVVKTLDVSRNKVTRGLKIILDAFESSPIVLEKVGLDHCGVADSDLFHFLRLAPNLASVSATNNPDLTSITLRRLLEHGSLNYVNVAYCTDIWRYFDTASTGWFVGLNCHPGRAVFKVSGENGAFLEAVAVMFREKYREHLTVKVEARGLTVILDSS